MLAFAVRDAPKDFNVLSLDNLLHSLKGDISKDQLGSSIDEGKERAEESKRGEMHYERSRDELRRLSNMDEMKLSDWDGVMRGNRDFAHFGLDATREMPLLTRQGSNGCMGAPVFFLL